MWASQIGESLSLVVGRTVLVMDLLVMLAWRIVPTSGTSGVDRRPS